MILKRLFLFFLTVSFASCLDTTENECSNVVCTGFGVFAFDVRSGDDNVFDIGTYTVLDVEVDDTNTQIDVDSSSGFSDVPILLVQDPDWSDGDFDYLIEIGDESFTVSATFELSEQTECCGSVPLLSAMTINDVPISLPVTSGVFTVNL